MLWIAIVIGVLATVFMLSLGYVAGQADQYTARDPLTERYFRAMHKLDDNDTTP